MLPSVLVLGLSEVPLCSAEDIATELQFQLPKLIFLSGCNTGYSRDAGIVPSMAETLLNQGATAVLAWGQRVLDTDASATAAKLYQELSAGKMVTEAVAVTYQTLLEQQARDWHLLRLYVAESLPGALVKRGRYPVPRPSVAQEFVDSEKKLRVATRETFVGRRRQLQNCLRILKTSSEKIGVLIHGMGGLGKSTIAARLCDRLSEHKKIVWWRQIYESSLVSELANNLENQEQRTRLREGKEELKFRLKTAFSKLKQLVLVFDDFEWNLEPRNQSYVLKPEAAKVLNALIWAIKNQENITYHRIIITCRYSFESDLLQSFYKQPLEGLRKSDLQKKLKQLEAFNSDKNEKLIERALQLADGNPRLLEWLNDDVLSKEDADSQLSKFEASSTGWREKIIWETEDAPKLKIDQSIEKIVSRCLVFEIHVPISALEAVCESISGYKEQLNRAIGLGLIEVSPELEESNRVYWVSRILPHIIPSIQLPEGTEVYSLYQKAHDKLHQLWGNKDNKSEEKWREIFRLKFANRENSERFRQGFSQMLDVQYNSEAGQAYESELRKVADDLVEDRLCSLLENYLKQKQWKQADEETAWIFYQVMVKENYEDWEYLLHNFPCEILKEINQLWLQNSNNKFGISIQMEIYRSLGGTEKYDSNVWNEFCDLVPSRDHKRERVHREGSMVSECQRGAYPAKIFDNYLGFEKGRGFGEGQWWWFGLKDSSET
ncbi:MULTISPECIES: GUN4 domain-containing protein [Cyanophyceae]|uniref:GUN4 domain-containing protein n=3 Tax=Cyanobacteriota TaxID=1117 RepID=UPI00232AFDC2|nr:MULTISPECIES: GUN4 domain-containing protein [Cyanophyceae]MDB9316941.1 GUN4 domain-containing protein [Nodularia spumigena CS-590/01A]MDB9337384.1 GUN4 domain-containing protein [Nodularia spumigena CS-590/01]MDB9340034.1 GUN4 domain-containing protein [Nodularia spumigena CS-589/07]MDB9402617.1 GUN4 domain-containing protein [Microcystis aeruginosa CS-567/02-A1]MDB9500306.1 GUN4 domain-containing protein [Nodularia spumigena CS-336/02]